MLLHFNFFFRNFCIDNFDCNEIQIPSGGICRVPVKGAHDLDCHLPCQVSNCSVEILILQSCPTWICKPKVPFYPITTVAPFTTTTAMPEPDSNNGIKIALYSVSAIMFLMTWAFVFFLVVSIRLKLRLMQSNNAAKKWERRYRRACLGDTDTSSQEQMPISRDCLVNVSTSEVSSVPSVRPKTSTRRLRQNSNASKEVELVAVETPKATKKASEEDLFTFGSDCSDAGEFVNKVPVVKKDEPFEKVLADCKARGDNTNFFSLGDSSPEESCTILQSEPYKVPKQQIKSKGEKLKLAKFFQSKPPTPCFSVRFQKPCKSVTFQTIPSNNLSLSNTVNPPLSIKDTCDKEWLPKQEQNQTKFEKAEAYVDQAVSLLTVSPKNLSPCEFYSPIQNSPASGKEESSPTAADRNTMPINAEPFPLQSNALWESYQVLPKVPRLSTDQSLLEASLILEQSCTSLTNETYISPTTHSKFSRTPPDDTAVSVRSSFDSLFVPDADAVPTYV